jgi:hypothetical protein
MFLELAWVRKNNNLTTLQSVHIEVERSTHSKVAAKLESSTMEDEAFGVAWLSNTLKGRFFVNAFKKACFLMPWSAGKEKKGDEAYLAMIIRVSGALYQRYLSTHLDLCIENLVLVKRFS